MAGASSYGIVGAVVFEVDYLGLSVLRSPSALGVVGHRADPCEDGPSDTSIPNLGFRLNRFRLRDVIPHISIVKDSVLSVAAYGLIPPCFLTMNIEVRKMSEGLESLWVVFQVHDTGA